MKIIQTYKILNENVSFAGVPNNQSHVDPYHWLWTHYSMKPYLRSVASELSTGNLNSDNTVVGAFKHGMFMGFPRYEQSMWTDKVLRHPHAISVDKATKILGRPLTAHEKRTLNHFTTGFNGWTNSMGKHDAMLDMSCSGVMMMPVSAAAAGKAATIVGKPMVKYVPNIVRNAAGKTKQLVNSGTKAAKAAKVAGDVVKGGSFVAGEFAIDAAIQHQIEKGFNLFQYDSKEYQEFLRKTENDPRLRRLLYNEVGRLNQNMGQSIPEEIFHIMGNRTRNSDEEVFHALFGGLNKNNRKYNPIALSQEGLDFWNSYMASGKKIPASFLPGEDYTDYHRRRTGISDRGWEMLKKAEKHFPDYYKGEGLAAMKGLPYFSDYQKARQAFDLLSEKDKRILQGRISDGWDETNELLIRDFGRYDLNVNQDGSLSWGKDGWFSKSTPIDLKSLDETQLQTLLYNLQGRNYTNNKELKDRFVKETGTQRRKETKKLPVSNIATRRDVIEPQQTISYDIEDKDWMDNYVKWASSNAPGIKEVQGELDRRFPVLNEDSIPKSKNIKLIKPSVDTNELNSTIKEGEKIITPKDIQSSEKTEI